MFLALINNLFAFISFELMRFVVTVSKADHRTGVRPSSKNFDLSALYSMYLRISELSASPRWTPMMNHFQRDGSDNWWFTTVGKENKERQIAASNDMLKALKRWRNHLGLSPLPSPADNSPLLPRTKGKGPISNTSYIRKIVQNCFDKAMDELNMASVPLQILF